MKKVLLLILGGTMIVLSGIGIASLVHRPSAGRSDLGQIISSIPSAGEHEPPKRWPDGKYSALTDSDDVHRLKMLLLLSKKDVNTNDVTYDDLDLSGWQDADRKTLGGANDALKEFLEAAWEKANARKLGASKR